MIKFIHFADTHFAENKCEDAFASHDTMTKYAIDYKPTFFVHAGDLWDTTIRVQHNTPFTRVIDKYKELSDIAPILIIKGNHDKAGSLDIFNKITDNRIMAVEDPFKIIGLVGDRFISLDEINDNGLKPKILINVITYPEKNILLTPDEIKKAENLNEKVNEKIEEFLLSSLELTKNFKCHKINVFHGSVQNYKKCDGQYTPSGGDFQVSAKTLNINNPDYVAMGHIHNYQTFGPSHSKICYSGATWATNAGEIDDKFFCTIELDGKNYKHEKINLNCRKRISYEINLNDHEKPFEFLNEFYNNIKKNKKDYIKVNLTFNNGDQYKLKHIKSLDNIKINMTPLLVIKNAIQIKDINKLKTIEDEINLYYKQLGTNKDKEVEDIILKAYDEYKSNLKNAITVKST